MTKKTGTIAEEEQKKVEVQELTKKPVGPATATLRLNDQLEGEKTVAVGLAEATAAGTLGLLPTDLAVDLGQVPAKKLTAESKRPRQEAAEPAADRQARPNETNGRDGPDET